MDFNRIKKIHMIGIKGVGMTMLAQYFVGQGINVTGSDVTERFMTDTVLEKEKIHVYSGFSEENIAKEVDLIVYSTAYNEENNIELKKALAGKVRVLKYAEAMGEVFNYKYGIAVCGSHGKTTTTAWLGYVMHKAGLDPSVMVGSRVPQFDGASLIGDSQYLVIEADEYQNKLGQFDPKIVLLNNIDYDHPDFFPTQEDYKKVFVNFIKKIPGKGVLIANFDDAVVKKIAYANCVGKVVTYAIDESADFVAYDIKQNDNKQFFKVKLGIDDSVDDGEMSDYNLGDFSIQLHGKHSVSNALAVIATCVEFGIELVKIRSYLAEFTGTARRAEVLGTWRGATIIDDYAHHPTEIKTTIAGLKKAYPKQKIRVVFHPHTFTRTKELLNDFASSFEDANEINVLDIYGSAREMQGGVHSLDLVNRLKNNYPEKNINYLPKQDDVEKYLRDSVERGDIILLMGAGDVFRIAEKLLS